MEVRTGITLLPFMPQWWNWQTPVTCSVSLSVKGAILNDSGRKFNSYTEHQKSREVIPRTGSIPVCGTKVCW